MVLSSVLQTLKPSLSKSSCDTYASLLRGMLSSLNLTGIPDRNLVVTNAKEFIQHIEKTCENKPKKAKQCYSALLVFEGPDFFEPNDRVFDQFRNLIHQHNQNDMSIEEKQELTKKQQQAYLSWSEIKKRSIS